MCRVSGRRQAHLRHGHNDTSLKPHRPYKEVSIIAFTLWIRKLKFRMRRMETRWWYGE